MSGDIFVRGTKFAASAPGANTGIFSGLATAGVTGKITPKRSDSAFRVTVSLATSSVFKVTFSDGSTMKKSTLNSGVALNATDLNTFTFAVRKDYAYDFEVVTDGVIDYLCVEEVAGALI